ncbi:hypothetical protein FOWG_15853 [Fusarium oxysporum f. sp. lycopersici MN25]|nr:hypothetical protein FOWG_15853 [Fusarium oxysporum f. sp. lycopersici MN25]
MVSYFTGNHGQERMHIEPRASRSYYFTFNDDYYFRYTFVIAN